MTLKTLLATICAGLILTGSMALAATTECSESTANLQYKAYNQEGGPCCGHWTSSLTYKGQSLKETSAAYLIKSAGPRWRCVAVWSIYARSANPIRSGTLAI